MKLKRIKINLKIFFKFNDIQAFNQLSLFNLPLHNAISWCCREYPRYLDRIDLINLCVSINDKIALAGKGWELSEFNKFHQGIISMHELSKFYQNAKINLCNNTHGVGIAQTRILEIMMSGQFVFSHKSKFDKDPEDYLIFLKIKDI